MECAVFMELTHNAGWAIFQNVTKIQVSRVELSFSGSQRTREQHAKQGDDCNGYL